MSYVEGQYSGTMVFKDINRNISGSRACTAVVILSDFEIIDLNYFIEVSSHGRNGDFWIMTCLHAGLGKMLTFVLHALHMYSVLFTLPNLHAPGAVSGGPRLDSLLSIIGAWGSQGLRKVTPPPP